MQTTNQLSDLEALREAKEVIAYAIKSFVKDPIPERRLAVHVTVNAIMRNHNKTRMKFGSYEVIRHKNNNFITIKSRQQISISDVITCPTCEKFLKFDDLTYVQTQQEGFKNDLVVWGCPKCGELFSRWERKERIL